MAGGRSLKYWTTLPGANSDFSWMIDFTARRAKARADMAPHLTEVQRQKNHAVALKEKLGTLKKANGDDQKMAVYREELLATEKSGRESQTKADAIDATTFDLKAVNPPRQGGTRHPHTQRDTVHAALQRLRLAFLL